MRKSEPTEPATKVSTAANSMLPWVALALAAVVVLVQAAFAYTAGSAVGGGQGTAAQVLLFISLVVSLTVVVVATVALAQHHPNRWASLVSLGAGVNVLIVSVASFFGGLAGTAA